MSSHTQQQQQQQQQQHTAAAVAAATVGFYPSTGYFHENKQLMSTTTAPNSVYCDQSMNLPTHSSVEQDMANAVVAFSSPSLPPLSQLLPSNSATTTTTQRPSHKDNNTNKTSTERSYSNGSTADNKISTVITPNVTTRPSIIYQPSPTVPSHPKIPSNHNHPDMYYRSSNTATTMTPTTINSNPVVETTPVANDPYYMTMTTFNPTTASIISPTTTSVHHPLVFPPSVVQSSSVTTSSVHPSSIIPSQSTNYPHIPSSAAETTRLSFSHQGNGQQHHLPSPPISYDQYPMEQQQSQKVFSFVSLPGVNQKKRPRRKYHEVERLYHCSYLGCSKSYGTLNHLNAHVQMQDHGPKRHPSEFKELRKIWRKQKRENQGNKKKNDITGASLQKQQHQQHKSSNQRFHPPSMPTHPVQSLIHHPLPPPPPLPTVLYPPPSNHWITSVPPPPPHPSSMTHPILVQHQQNAAAAGIPPNTIGYQ